MSITQNPYPFPSQEDGWIDVPRYIRQHAGDAGHPSAYSRDFCRALEHGQILFFPEPPFELSEAELSFLLSQRQGGSPLHKNISYRPEEDRLNGMEGDADTRKRLQDFMRGYSRKVTAFASEFLAHYAAGKRLDYASFRTIEERGRPASLHKRNDLLHVDAFPTRPTFGARILRVFTNVNPREDRVWRVGEPFHALVPQMAEQLQRDGLATDGPLAAAVAWVQRWGQSAGLPLRYRSAYDRCMLRLHDWLKENQPYQNSPLSRRIAFPPASTWLVFTDGVPHAVLSGRYALEQTYIIPQQSLVAPEVSPLQVLQRLVGRTLAS
jgi:hypothetical protein